MDSIVSKNFWFKCKLKRAYAVVEKDYDNVGALCPIVFIRLQYIFKKNSVTVTYGLGKVSDLILKNIELDNHILITKEYEKRKSYLEKEAKYEVYLLKTNKEKMKIVHNKIDEIKKLDREKTRSKFLSAFISIQKHGWNLDDIKSVWNEAICFNIHDS
ncbi:MAG TPA: hypothetical protein ENI76_07840 [Ignavibacteria bacterium]|nr:hypothetical protein [Ignavibacteria bacterium]